MTVLFWSISLGMYYPVLLVVAVDWHDSVACLAQKYADKE